MPGRISRRAFIGSLAAAPLASHLGMPRWSDGEEKRGRSRTRQAGERTVVVGAGAFGGWIALALRRAGQRVTLVDAWGPGNSRASSGGETRVIRGVYGGVSTYSQMAARAMALWREAEQQWQRQVLFRTGALWLCEADDAYVRSSIEPMRAAGLALEELSAGETARRWPQISTRGVRSAWFEPEAGYLTARLGCELVRETFVREGGQYRQDWARPGLTAGSRMSDVSFSDGSTLGADHFVFACGPWMGQLFPDVIGRRIVATRQEVFFFGTPAGDARYEGGSLPAWVHIGDRLVYGIPVHDHRGLKIADDTAGDEVDPTTMRRTPSEAGLVRAREVLRDRFPALAGAPLVEARVCQYEASSDGHFLVDRHPQFENVWLVGGGSGHGFKMGPALGEHVAALIQDRAPVHPLFAYGRLQPRPGGRSR